MKILLVDDEANARAALRGMIETNFPDYRIVDEASNVPDAVKSIRKHHPDLVLLDIEMPGYLGIDLLDFFDPQEINFKIIFITAYNDYALKAFELAAVDYLLKPTRVDQLERAFSRLATQNGNENERYFALKDNLDKKIPDKLALLTAEGMLIVKVDSIRYFKADGAYTHIHFTDGERVTVSKTLQEYNPLEETGYFFRIKGSYIINIHCVAKISKRDGGYLVMDNGEEISASLEKRSLLYAQFKDRTF